MIDPEKKVYVYFIVFVGILGSIGAIPRNSAKRYWFPKPGICPKDPSRCLPTEDIVTCLLDSDCAGSMKCCSDGCTLICTDVNETISPTTMSTTTMSTTTTSPTIISTTPEEEKPSSCPPLPSFDITECPPVELSSRCLLDSDCERSQKCCSDGCALLCMDTVLSKKAETIFPTTVSTTTISQTTISTIPEDVNPSSCPPVSSFNVTECPLEGFSSGCLLDSDCERSQKCCSNGCALLCMDTVLNKKTETIFPTTVSTTTISPTIISTTPEEEKPSSCPPLSSFDITECPPAELSSECLLDSDCEKSQKCCSNGCTLLCIDNVLNKKTETMSTTTMSTTIISTTPEDVKPLYCPPLSSFNVTECLPAELSSGCLLDSDCEKSQKCCSDGCTLRCMDTAVGNGKEKQLSLSTTSPTTISSTSMDKLLRLCPTVSFSLGSDCPPADDWNQCIVDSDCEESQKCCSDGCNLRCMDAIVEEIKEKTTLPTIVEQTTTCPTVTECPTVDATQSCLVNSDCQVLHKCCSNGCSLRCIEFDYYETKEFVARTIRRRQPILQ